MFYVQTACRFGKPSSVKNYAADDRAALVARVILRIFDHSNDVPAEIEALLRAEFAEVAHHG
jgi:hypothetical protein